MSRIQKAFSRSVAATESASHRTASRVVYGSSGDWPRLSLVERVCVGHGQKAEEGHGPWTKIGEEVNRIGQTTHIHLSPI